MTRVTEVVAVIWIECDCCKKMLTRREPYFKVQVERMGTASVPMVGASHLCESCFLKIRNAAEVVKHDE